MGNFFSDIQGKFKAEYIGGYLAHIVEEVSKSDLSVIHPILNKASLGYKGNKNNKFSERELETVQVVSEYEYDAHDKKRRADLYIGIQGNGIYNQILVEIKVRDGFISGQLESYVKWAEKRNQKDDRAIVVLTAFPIDEIAADFIKKNNSFISHMYVSELSKEIGSYSAVSDLARVFDKYLYEEGYAMYQLRDPLDKRAFLSFMAMNFLPIEAGHGKISSEKNVSRGPIVFSNIVSNWQLVSNRVAAGLGLGRIPTIRYFPEQVMSGGKNGGASDVFSVDDILAVRQQARKDRSLGRYWLVAECVCVEGKLRLEWGQIIKIKIKKHSDGDREFHIDCQIYALVRWKANQYGASIKEDFKEGVFSDQLYVPEEFIDIINQQIKKAVLQAAKNPAVGEDIKGILLG